jgi:putative glutathione S-transferase
MMNAAFAAAGASGPDLYPQALHDEIETINRRVYRSVNNGVYRCGFATAQHAYEEAFHELFEALDEIELRLGTRRYLAGDRMISCGSSISCRGVAGTVRFDQIKTHYYRSHPTINPTGIVPLGLLLDFTTPHDRDRISQAP